jgi:hypothetical protein
VEKTQGLEEGLAWVSAERDALKDEADHEAAAAQSLRTKLAKMKTKLELKEGAVAQAIQMAEAARAEILQWKQKVEGNVPSTLSLGFGGCFSAYPLVPICLEQAWRKIWPMPKQPL